MLRTAGTMALIVILLAPASFSPAQDAAADKLSQADLEEMLGPIALYPDSLLANVLAASVYPEEVAQAAKLGPSGDVSKLEPPVQAVAKVPEVLSMLGDNLDWTTAIGQAYLAQPGDVTAAIQSLRDKAKDNGTLQSNDQQTVVDDGSAVVIESAEPDVVYVPQYNPQVVYASPGYGWGTVAAGAITFGAGIAVGTALDNIDCDWHGGGLSWGHWGGYHGDVDIDRNYNRNINTGDINVNNRPRPGNEGQRWTPNRDKVPMDNGRYRTDKLNQYKGDCGRQAVNQMHKPAARPAGGTPGAARPAARPAGGSPGAATPARPPLKKVSPPKNVPGAGSYNRPATPAGSYNRPATPARQPSATPSRTPSRTPSAFNQSGASKATANRGSASRGGSQAARPSGGGRSSGARGGGGVRGGGGRR